MTLAGVYEIKNTVNGHRYIGGSVDLTRRMHEHKNELQKHCHCNSHLQNACDKHGESNFVFTPLLYCDRENVLLYEQICIDGLHPEYNIAKDATAVMLGRTHTEEAKTRMSNSHKGAKRGHPSEETIAKIRAGNIGKKHTEEDLVKMRAARSGKPQQGGVKFHSDATKLQMSQSHSKTTTRPGYRPSAETRLKISMGSKGHVKSEETRQNMRDAWVIRKDKTQTNINKEIKWQAR